MTTQIILPNLEERFLPPDNWQTGDFINPETTHQIHYNFILPPTNNSKGIIVILPGLSEFGEKYIETARFFSDLGYGIYIIDWAYQGRSTRLKDSPQKRYSDGYETDISDLDFFIKNIIGTTKPLYMLAHSMGSNIGLRYLIDHQNIFTAASFSAPMLGIKDLRFFPNFLKLFFLPFASHYIPGGKDWHETARSSDGKDIFSSDPIRDQIHNSWSLSNPELQVGNTTYKWLYESLKSISLLKDSATLQKVTIPVLAAKAGKETLVDNKSIDQFIKKIPNGKLLDLKKSKHEIMVETDDIRDLFLAETLKTFNQ